MTPANLSGGLAMAAAILVAQAGPPPPPGAARLDDGYAWDTRAKTCGVAAMQATRTLLPYLDLEQLVLPGDTSWTAVVRHYDAALSGWRPTDLPKPDGDCPVHLRAWQRGSGKLVVAVLDETFPAVNGPVKVLWVMTERDNE